MGYSPDEEPEGSSPKNAESDEDGEDNEDDLERAASGIWRCSDGLRGRGDRRRCGYRSAAGIAGLSVGGQCNSTFRTEAGHDDLLLVVTLIRQLRGGFSG
jgi:hypothetical protein